MDKYFTFFFCSFEWHEPNAAFSLTRALIDLVRPKTPLTLLGRRLSDSNSLKASIEGNYNEFKDSLEQLSGSQFIITNSRFASEGAEIHVCFEKIIGDLCYEAIKDTREEQKTTVKEASTALKTFSISVRRDLWQGNRLETVFREEVGKAFANMSAIYGYGDYTPLPVPGRYSLIWGNSRAGLPRVVDFDYENKIERIYKYNYLSNQTVAYALIKKCPAHLQTQFKATPLLDKQGLETGVMVQTEEGLIECLSECLWNSQTD